MEPTSQRRGVPIVSGIDTDQEAAEQRAPDRPQRLHSAHAFLDQHPAVVALPADQLQRQRGFELGCQMVPSVAPADIERQSKTLANDPFRQTAGQGKVKLRPLRMRAGRAPVRV